jgi:CBS domain-containing protein
MKVQDLMSWEVEACGVGENLANAAMIMWRRDCGIVPVVENPTGRLAGVVTDRDICIAAATKHRDPALLTAGEIMTRDPRTCAPSDDVHVALRTMREAQVRRLPVTDRDGKLVGILSLNDCILGASGVERRTPSALTQRDVMDVLKAVSAHREKAALLEVAS